MVFIPGAKLLEEMNSERSGLWFGREDLTQEISIIAKLPTPTIKAISRGVQSSLIVSVVEVERYRVRIVGLRVDDDLDRPFYATHPSIAPDEHALVEEMLTYPQIRLHFFDERSRPVLSSLCFFDQAQAKQALNDMLEAGPHYTGEVGDVTEFAHDFFQRDQELIYFHHRKPAHTLVNYQIPLSVTPDEPVRVFELDQGEFRLDDSDEGGGLEQSVHGSLAYVYSSNTYRAPRVGEGKSRRELTDLLGFDSESICLIESKALSILGTSPIRSTDRRASSITKDIKKGLRQLRGAIRRVRAGEEIYNSQGEIINILNRSTSMIHAIVLVSEMNPFIDWRKVASKILEISKESQRVFFHVLDLQELQRLAIFSRKPSFFCLNLLILWRAVKANGTAFVKGEFLPMMEFMDRF